MKILAAAILTMLAVGLLANVSLFMQAGVFVTASYMQFLYTAFAPHEKWKVSLIWLAVPIGSVYFFGWWALAPWLAGSMVGGVLRAQQNIKDQAEDQ